jgi:hypothetical protein
MASYKVKRNFSDKKGKAWKQGEPWSGAPDEATEHLATGNIEEVTGQMPPGTGKQSGSEGGGASA